MNNFNFLLKFLELQLGITLDRIVNVGLVKICTSKDKTPYWNYALINQIVDVNNLLEMEKVMKGFKRNPTFYFESARKEIAEFLLQNDYSKSFEDSWMFYQGGLPEINRPESVKKVKNRDELELFLTIFNDCYQKDDPQNVYGELDSGYLTTARESWIRHHSTNRVEYFVVYKKEKPVAVSSLTNFEDIGYISNVGSLKEVREQGFGKLATLYCLEQSIKHGNSLHCLATEEGTYPNEFYKRIGFQTKFTAVGYTKKE